MTTHGVAPGRAHRGSNLVALIAMARQLGILDNIIQHASPAAKGHLTGPLPLATTMIPSSVLDSIYEATEAAVGRSGLRRLGYEMVRGRIAVTAKPLIDGTIAMYGLSPEVMLEHFGDFTGPFVEGYSFRFESAGAHAGTMIIDVESPIHPLAIAVWEGGIEYFMGVGGAGSTASISSAQMSPDRMRARIDIRW